MSFRLKSLLSTSSLGFRLGSTLVLALMPLGILSVVQTQSALREVETSTLEGVAGASLRAVQPQIDLIKNAKISARVLAAALSFVLEENANCIERVKAVAKTIPEALVVAYVPVSGLMTCSSTGTSQDVSADPSFQLLTQRALASVTYTRRGPVSKAAVVAIGHPVFNRAGAQVGIVVISLPYFSVAPGDYTDPFNLWQPSYLATLAADGTLLMSSDETMLPSAFVPAGFPLDNLASRAGMSAYDASSNEERIVSVTSMANDLYLLSIWQHRSEGFWTWTGIATPYLIPVLTWVAALVAAALASGRLVVRHVRSLSLSMSDYMSNRAQVVIPDINEAPTEIQRLHAVYDQLIRTIERDEAELQNLLVDKDVLLREVNHRSGNSLQIIASVMRMYRRESKDESLRGVLDSLINRVIALSSTHTSLYSMSGRRDVPMDEILSNVVRRLKEIHGVAMGVAKKQFEPIRMPAESAVPLALALAETISCLFTSRSVATAGVDISLAEHDGRIRMVVNGPEVQEFQPTTTTGVSALPRRMLMQFASQLRGNVAIQIDGHRSIITLDFPREV